MPRQNQLPKAHKTLDCSWNTKDMHATEKPVTEIQKAWKHWIFDIYILCVVYH